MTWMASLGPRKVRSHSPSMKMPGQAAKSAMTSIFMVSREKM